MLVLKGLVGLHRTVQLQLLQRFGWGIDLDYCDIEWFASGKETSINACGLSAMFSQNSENSLNIKKRKNEKQTRKILLVINRDLRRRAFVESEETRDF